MQNGLGDIRRKAGFKTQENLASCLKVDRAAIAKWETGANYPQAPMLVKLSETLCVPEGEIIAAITAAKENTAITAVE